jgi:hypothetical protein
MEDWLKADGEDGEERWQNLQELLTVTHKYDELAAGAIALLLPGGSRPRLGRSIATETSRPKRSH